MIINIDNEIREITPNFNVGVMECDIQIYKDNKITEIINDMEKEIQKNININDVVNLNTIIDGRNAYKKYGKDPSRYRLAVESLYRRISKGNGLYRINNVVDLGNIISLKTRRSVAVLDIEKITGNIVIRLGKVSDDFHGIGRGRIKIENIPLYEDDFGPFGSTTSDTERTMITNSTTKILLFIISFNGLTSLEDELNYTETLYREYAKGSKFKKYIL